MKHEESDSDLGSGLNAKWCNVGFANDVNFE
jgi:hypothetical protein